MILDYKITEEGLEACKIFSSNVALMFKAELPKNLKIREVNRVKIWVREALSNENQAIKRSCTRQGW